MQIKHFMYVPFTGLGLYQGFRGNRWLKNRIKVFKQFVVASLMAQTNKNFTLWISWRPEEKENKHVEELASWLSLKSDLDWIMTFGGLCFYDDKFEEAEALEKLKRNLKNTLCYLKKIVGNADYVYMTIQPSDDCYYSGAVEEIQEILKNVEYSACGFTKGYICNYLDKDVSEYNPTTNPPFATIKFKADVFIDPEKHIEYTSIKDNIYENKV